MHKLVFHWEVINHESEYAIVTTLAKVKSIISQFGGIFGGLKMVNSGSFFLHILHFLQPCLHPQCKLRKVPHFFCSYKEPSYSEAVKMTALASSFLAVR